MKMHPLADFRLFAWLFATLIAFAARGAHAGAIGPGTYSGIYSGGDYGVVTIVVDAQGNVTCDFFSSPNFVHHQATGTVATDSSWYLVNCMTPNTAAYHWSVSSNPSSAPGNAIIGFWGGGTSSAQISGNFTAYYTSIKTDPAGSITSGSFAGLWYEPAFTGTGFNILPSSAVGLIVTYYGVNASGGPLWLISDYGPKTITIGAPITLNMSYSNSGTFQAPKRVPVSWGQLTLTFTGCTTATATLTGTDGTVSENLAMLTGVIGMPGCT